jgi:hypothetical protein
MDGWVDMKEEKKHTTQKKKTATPKRAKKGRV